jgi:hypothetical protein
LWGTEWQPLTAFRPIKLSHKLLPIPIRIAAALNAARVATLCDPIVKVISPGGVSAGVPEIILKMLVLVGENAAKANAHEHLGKVAVVH